MSAEAKAPGSPSYLEVDSEDLRYQSRIRRIRLIDNIRVALTVLSLLCGITVLGTSGHALSIYNATHVSSNFNLALWPTQFDVQPTIALIAGSGIVVFVNIVSLVFSKVKMLRGRFVIHTAITFITPLFGFAAAIIGMVFFYVVNASAAVDTLQSWSCQWEILGMTQQPHFGTLCKQSKTALYLSIILIPIEAIVLSVAGWQMIMERKFSGTARSQKRSSPALS